MSDYKESTPLRPYHPMSVGNVAAARVGVK